jgi:hypothetical protein
MQAAADALALAGARELDLSSGAETRATNAMANTAFGNDNTLFGMGTAPLFTYSSVFYSGLPAATAGITGTVAQGDSDAKFVAVTVTPVTIPTIFPVKFLNPGGTNSFSAGAQAIAGFTKKVQIACDIPPVFVCNPYETSGMTDAAATSTLNSNLADPATTRRQIRLDPTKSGPGQFGYLVPPDNCQGASCLENWIALAHPSTCYQSASVDLNTGFKSAVTDGFNVRFDIYLNNLKKDIGNASYAPSINVRKGFQATDDKWCSVNPATPPTPYFTTLPSPPGQTASLVPNATNTTVTGDIDPAGNNNCTKTPSPCVIKNVQSAVITQVKLWLATASPNINDTTGGTKIPTGAIVTLACNATDAAVAKSACQTAGANTLTISKPVSASKQTGVALTIGWPTSGLPEDTAWTGICDSGTCLQGNGQWDCADYWSINHYGVAIPADLSALGTCSTPTLTTVSRYQVYRSEIANNLHTAFSWPGSAGGLSAAQASATGAESGAPYCAVNGVDTSTGATDRRVIFAAVVNCLAQSSLITGGSTANNIPVAGFAKFFMTQPVGADSTPNSSTVYGEMTGLVTSLDNVKIENLNQVQLYR